VHVRVHRAVVAALAVAAMALVAVPALAQVSSDWPQFQGDAAHTGISPNGPEPPFELLWHAPVELGGPLGTQGLSAPVVSGDLVIAVAPEEVLAFDLATGAKAWSVPRTLGPPAQPAVASVDGRPVLLYTEGWAGHPPRAGVTGPTGPASTPSPSPGADGTTGPVDSRLVAIDLETREQVWEPVELTEVSGAGVTVDGERAYVADGNGQVFAVDASTGEVDWSESIGRPVDAPPAVAGGAIVVTGRGTATSPAASVVAIEAADGSPRWRQVVDSPAVLSPSAPAIAAGSALVTFSDGTVRAYDLGSGTQRWSSRPGETPSPSGSAVALFDDAAFVTDTDGFIGSVYRFDTSSGSVVWDFAINEPIIQGAPVVSSGSVLVATAAGSLNAFDPTTGERIWRGDRAGSLHAITPAGSVVVAVRSRPRAGLDAFGPDPEGRLSREMSPTTPEYPRILGTFAIVAVPLAALALVVGRFLTARMGPAFEDEAGAEDER